MKNKAALETLRDNDEKQTSAFVQLVEKEAKAGVSPIRKGASWMGRAMINQQMKMFDISA